MSRCVKCFSIQHPDYCLEREIRGDVVTVCAWCETDKKELTVTDDNGKVVKIVKKDEESVKYKRYLAELLGKSNVADIIQNGAKPI